MIIYTNKYEVCTEFRKSLCPRDLCTYYKLDNTDSALFTSSYVKHDKNFGSSSPLCFLIQFGTSKLNPFRNVNNKLSFNYNHLCC